MSSLFQVDTGFEIDYEPWFNDLLKWGSVYLVFNFLSKYVTEQDPFDMEYFQNMVFLMVALSAYHLVVKKVVAVA